MRFNAYLTEEVVEDYADGILSRREALRRLSMLGVAAGLAVPLLAACDSAAQDGATPTAASASASAAGPAPLPTEPITFDAADGREVQGAWSAAERPRGAVLVVHENRGLTDHIRSVVGRLAASGYSALAVDLLSGEGGTGAFKDEAEVSAALNNVPDDRFVADMKAAVSELGRRAPDAEIGAVGFCFGGGMVWSLLASGEPRLAAAAPFYGPLPEGADFAGSPKAAVLGIYGELDERVDATRDAARKALEDAGLTHEIVTYPDAGHAFFNETGARYNPTAAAAAWEKLLAWFGTHLS
jgi:carboxymethylenebutenolidase